jgi:hypothetical protein
MSRAADDFGPCNLVLAVPTVGASRGAVQIVLGFVNATGKK